MALVTTSWILDLIFVLISLLGLIHFYYQKQFRLWQEQNVPHLKTFFPFKNVARTKSIGLTIKEIYDASKGEKYFGFWSLFRPMLLIRDLDLIKTVFVKDFVNFHDRGIYYNKEKDPLRGNIFVLRGIKWKYIRNKLSASFTSGKMKMMFPTLLECSKDLDALLNKHATKQETIEVKDIMARFTTDVIASCGLGIQANCLKDQDAEFRNWGRKYFGGSIRQMIISYCMFLTPRIAKLFKFIRTPKDVTEYFLKAIKETMDYREKNNIKRNDFIQSILEFNGVKATENDEKITFEELAAQIFAFYLAGFEPASTVLEFCLYELSLNPEIQNKTREEIHRVLAKHNGVLTYETVYEMEYVCRVIDETLRKYPTLPFLQRECNQEYQIPGTDVTIPKGTLVLVSSLGIQRDPEYYPEPEKFDPDRFTEEEKSKRHYYSYLPFGEGPRHCIGIRFGLMQARVGLITILAKYKFDKVKETPIPLEIDPKNLILAAKEGTHLKISKVSNELFSQDSVQYLKFL